MKSKNTGRIEHTIQPGDYFLNNDRTYIRHVQEIISIGRYYVNSYAIRWHETHEELEFNSETLQENTRLTKTQAHKMLKLAGYGT